MSEKELIKKAFQARENSYSPYSHFKVGVALLTKSGKVFLGTNVENCGYSPSNCAERSAFFSAISNGEKEFEKIAIVGGRDNIAYPCGICRQVMCEFSKDMQVIVAKNENDYKVFTALELLPYCFTKEDIK